jgi:ribosomal protein L19E
MDDLKKRTGRGGGNFKPSFNVPVRIHQVHVSNEKGATRGVDFLEGSLMAPAFGLEADAVVKVRIKDRGVPRDKERTPMEIYDLQPGKKKGTGARMGTHGAIVAENAQLLEDGTIECGWVKVVEHEYKEKPAGEWMHVGHVSVGFLRINEKDPTSPARQDRFIHFPTAARVISGQGEEALASFKDTVVGLLADRAEQAGGRPTVVVRLVNQRAIGTAGSVATATIWLGWDRDNKVSISPEATVDTWLANPDNAKWLNFIQNADNIAASDGVLEVWPSWHFNTGLKTAEREVKNKDAGKVHTAEQYAAPMINDAGEPLFTENGKRRTHYGLIAEGMHMVVVPENFTDWIANQTWTLESFPQKLFSIDDLPTDNLKPEVKKVFEDNAVKRVTDKRAARNATRDNEASQEQEQEQGQDFGSEGAAPDPAAGQFRPRG